MQEGLSVDRGHSSNKLLHRNHENGLSDITTVTTSTIRGGLSTIDILVFTLILRERGWDGRLIRLPRLRSRVKGANVTEVRLSR